jgi:hypothetical protein
MAYLGACTFILAVGVYKLPESAFGHPKSVPDPNQSSPNRTIVRLLSTALVAGFTFADRAISSKPGEQRRHNIQKAAAAYDSIMNFMDRVTFNEREANAFSEKVRQLKLKLDYLTELTREELKLSAALLDLSDEGQHP